MEILNTIIPIFVVILLGWAARRRGFLQPEFLGPANQMVYHLAIPAMIFRAISGTPLVRQFDVRVLAITLGAALLAFGLAWSAARMLRVGRSRRGTFIQNSFHGNLGYVGLAVAYYYLGREGLAAAGIVAGFLIILQNLLAVAVLQMYAVETAAHSGRWSVLWKVAGNPIIIATLLAIGASLLEIRLPVIIGRSLDILGGLALPMALLIIGASLSFEMIRKNRVLIFAAVIVKLGLLPAFGYTVFRLTGTAVSAYLPALILLASPTATVTYVMARELHGDPEFAVAAISASTLLSAVTFVLWLKMAG